MKPVIDEVIVVEGRYDKNTLAQIVDATIIEVGGFGLFKNSDLKQMLKALAEKKGLVVFTDSDGAGFVIRNHIKAIIPPSQLKHAYIPDIYAKEKRKQRGSKEGKLGVEGMSPDILLQALRTAGVAEKSGVPLQKLTKAELSELGLSGGENSSAVRKALCKKLGLPEHLSANAMLEILPSLFKIEELKREIDHLQISR